MVNTLENLNSPKYKISKSDYEIFCKEYIFEHIRGIKFGKAFCKKFDITVKPDESIYQSLRSQSPIIVALAKIVDKYEDDNTTPLYQQIINLLNENL